MLLFQSPCTTGSLLHFSHVEKFNVQIYLYSTLHHDTCTYQATSMTIGLKKMHFFLTDGASPDFLMSESWEWREGRLLAYELILKFLITNHIHYVFPTYVLPVSKASASSSSVDETLINRYSYNIRCT